MPSSQLVGKSLREAKITVAIGGIMRDDMVVPARGDTVIRNRIQLPYLPRGAYPLVEKLLSVRLDFF